ncbi:MAG: cobyrinate a,c-diamide synthase [Anaerovoracaceae bacterium]
MATIKQDVGRIILAATNSGSGKTTVTCGILKALKDNAENIKAFKCGPDYIDPMFHSEVLGISSRNLDLFFTDENLTKYLLANSTKDGSFAVMEGVMGYYDGLGGVTTTASTYDLARVTNTPVILVVDCKGKSTSIVAEIKGFMEYKKDSNIKAVILNRISGMMYPMIKNLIEKELPVKVAGYLPILNNCSIESRHLGLITASEIGNLKEIIENIGSAAKETIDLSMLVEIGKEAEAIQYDDSQISKIQRLGNVRIAVAMDKAFCFYYKDNLELLEKLGGELVYFSPVDGEPLPQNIGGVILGGGYPELYLRELEANKHLREEINMRVKDGMPILAECGGFMYLHKWIKDDDGKSFDMVGVIDGGSFPTGKLGRFGYIDVTTQRDTVAGQKGMKLKAHEFHYWDSQKTGDACMAAKPVGSRKWECICSDNEMFVGYPHFHYYSNLEFPRNFISKCIEYSNTKNNPVNPCKRVVDI